MRKSPFVFLATAFLLGLGSLGQFWTLLALSGQLTRIATVPLLGLLTVTALLLGRRHRSDLAVSLRNTLDELRRAPLGLRLVLVFALASFTYSFTSLGREFSGNSLALHMMVAKAAAASGLLERHWFQAGNESYGLIGEMTYAVLIQIGRDDAAQMVTWVVLFAIAATLVGICAEVGIGLRGQIVAMTSLITSTAVLIWVGEGKIDLISTSSAPFTLFLIPRADLSLDCRPQIWMVAGLFAGLAVATKLILGFFLVIMISLLLFWSYAPAAIRTRHPGRL